MRRSSATRTRTWTSRSKVCWAANYPMADRRGQFPTFGGPRAPRFPAYGRHTGECPAPRGARSLSLDLRQRKLRNDPPITSPRHGRDDSNLHPTAIHHRPHARHSRGRQPVAQGTHRPELLHRRPLPRSRGRGPGRLGLGPELDRSRDRRGHVRSPGTASRSASTGYSPTARSRPKRPCGWRLAIAGSLAIEGPVVRWVADHRKHHKFSDQDGDPHSPWRYGETLPALIKGLWYAHMGWLFDEEQTPQQKYAPDLLKDPAIRRGLPAFRLLVAVSLLLPAAGRRPGEHVLAGRAHGVLLGLAGPRRAAAPRHVVDQLDLPRGGRAAVQVPRPVRQRVVAGGAVAGRVLAQPAPRRPDLRPGTACCAARSTPAPGSSGWFEQLGWAHDVRWPTPERIAARGRASDGDGAEPASWRRDRPSRPDQQVRRPAVTSARRAGPGAAGVRMTGKERREQLLDDRPHALRRARLRRHLGRGDRRPRPASPSRWCTSTSAARRACTRSSSTARCAPCSTW